MKRKTPIRLTRGPLSERVYAVTNYRAVSVNGREQYRVVGDGKHDVTADFESLMLEELLGEAPDLVATLEGASLGMELTDAERDQIGVAWRKVRAMVERHNARVDERMRQGASA